MGIQINGNTDTISAIDGGLTVSGASLGSSSASSLNISGIVTTTTLSVTNIKHPSFGSNIFVLDSTGNINIDSGGVYYDATNNRLAIGTNIPSAIFHTKITTDRNLLFNTSLGGDARITALNDANSANVNFVLQGDNVILQTGGGAARVDSSGRLLMGTSSSSAAASIVCQGTSSSSTSGAQIWMQRGQSSGSISSGDTLGRINFADNAGNAYAIIEGATDATGGTNDYPGRLVFSATRDGTSTPVEWLRLDSSGRFSAYGRNNGNNYYGSVGTYADAHTFCRVFGLDSTSTAWADQKSALFVHGNFGAGGNNQVPCASLTVLNWSSGATNPGAIMRGWKGDASLLEGTPVLQFQVNHNGNVTNTNNSYGSLSDIRYKQDITLAGSQWEDIKNISIKKFRFIDDVKNETEENPAPYLLGCIAQEVAEVSPGLVEVRGDDKDEDGNVIPEVLTLKYSVLYMKAIKALQEAQERIETLEAEVAELKSKVI